MHVVFLTDEYPLEGRWHGGVGTFVRLLGQELATRGVRVSVVGFYPTGTNQPVQDDGLHVYALRWSTWPVLAWVDYYIRYNRCLKEIFKTCPYSVVDAPEGFFAYVRKLPGVTYVLRMHGGHHFFAKYENRPLNTRRAFAERLSFRKADRLVGVSRYVVQSTARQLKVNMANVPIIANPAPLAHFAPRPVTPERGLILFVGTLVEKKGVRQLIMAMPKVLAEFPGARLLLVGRSGRVAGSQQDYKAYVQQFIAPGTAGCIEFLGPLPNHQIPELMARAAVCVYPSHMEALPLAWLEGMAMGKAVVASKTGPGPEVIQHGVDGLLCDPFSPDDIAHQILDVLNHPDKALEMGRQARESALQRFDVKKLADVNLKFYQSI
jgi:glycosyltransferase involved in cell wall biosynthesis